MGDGNPHSKRARGVPGADGSAGRDGVDSGGWVFLELVEQIIGKDVPGKIGIKVAPNPGGAYCTDAFCQTASPPLKPKP